MDVSLLDLWLPILVGAVAVFFASSIAHMLLPWHKYDYGKLPDEAPVLEGLRSAGLPEGCYRFPFVDSMAELKDEAMLQKWMDGPVGMITVMPSGLPRMGASLLQWFIYSVVVAAVAGYVASITLVQGADAMTVFRVTGAVAVLAHGTSNVMNSIWKGEPWMVSFKFAVDGLIYGLLTGGALAYLWPAV